jgi:hypothetical protein
MCQLTLWLDCSEEFTSDPTRNREGLLLARRERPVGSQVPQLPAIPEHACECAKVSVGHEEKNWKRANVFPSATLRPAIGKDKEAHPAFWAPFVPVGEGGAAP